MNNPHVFFFSERCPHSEKFYNLLKQHNKLQLFRLICIDRLRKVPRGITSVPTIIVPGYKVPLVGDDVFNWLQSTIQPPQFNQQQHFQKQSLNNMPNTNLQNNNFKFRSKLIITDALSAGELLVTKLSIN